MAMITQTFPDFDNQVLTYDPQKQVVVRDPNNPKRLIVMTKIDPPVIDLPPDIGS